MQEWMKSSIGDRPPILSIPILSIRIFSQNTGRVESPVDSDKDKVPTQENPMPDSLRMSLRQSVKESKL